MLQLQSEVDPDRLAKLLELSPNLRVFGAPNLSNRREAVLLACAVRQAG
jgi:hypothetical protein